MLHSPSLGLKTNPPYPPLTGVQEKTPPINGQEQGPSTRREEIAFLYPPDKGGRGG